MEELEEARIKIDKVCGTEKIASEIIKWIANKGSEWLLDIVRETWYNVTGLRENIFIVDKSNCNNYTPICLLTIALKYILAYLNKY